MLDNSAARASRTDQSKIERLARLFRPGSNAGVIDTDDPIGGAVRDAKILSAFAAQSRLNVPAEKLTALDDAAASLEAERRRGEGFSPNSTSKFWIAYDAMAMEMFPLSAHSIRSSIQINSRRFPGVLISPTTVNAAFAVIVFLMFLALQSFWVAGKDLVERADAIEVQKVELLRRSRQHENSIRRGDLRLKAITQDVCAISDCDEYDSPLSGRLKKNESASRLADLRTQYRVAKDELDIVSLQSSELNTDLRDLNERGRPLEILLTRWHDRAAEVCRSRIVGLLCPMKELSNGIDERKRLVDSIQTMRTDLSALRGRGDSSRYRVGLSTLSFGRQSELSRELMRAEQRLTEYDADRFRGRVVETRLLISNIGTYFIALIMGLLGALTYILRSVSQQLQDHTYIPVSVSLSIVRVCLGAIVGVFGSMLLPSSDVGLRSLPPLIIPFVFGYGIEILFSLLDKIVRSFTQPEPTNTGATRA